MPQPKSSSGRSGAAAKREADAGASALSSVRDLLARGVMVPIDRVQEALDDAVRRGRMTRDDAESLLQSLVSVGRAAGGAGRRARERTSQGTDRVLREMDRARRAAGIGSAFPITGYDDLNAAQIGQRLDELTAADLRKVRDYERRHGNRKTVLTALERKLG